MAGAATRLCGIFWEQEFKGKSLNTEARRREEEPKRARFIVPLQVGDENRRPPLKRAEKKGAEKKKPYPGNRRVRHPRRNWRLLLAGLFAFHDQGHGVGAGGHFEFVGGGVRGELLHGEAAVDGFAVH